MSAKDCRLRRLVDTNRKVFVYNTSGGLLGSWTAGSMNTSAQPEGITANGNDVWIVDNKTDKIFKYAGAASRLSGSQTAASSFSLNTGNTNSKDLVTDGNSIWVVDDSTTDNVFKYSVSGTSVGSWTIMPAVVAATSSYRSDCESHPLCKRPIPSKTLLRCPLVEVACDCWIG